MSLIRPNCVESYLAILEEEKLIEEAWERSMVPPIAQASDVLSSLRSSYIRDSPIALFIFLRYLSCVSSSH